MVQTRLRARWRCIHARTHHARVRMHRSEHAQDALSLSSQISPGGMQAGPDEPANRGSSSNQFLRASFPPPPVFWTP